MFWQGRTRTGSLFGDKSLGRSASSGVPGCTWWWFVGLCQTAAGTEARGKCTGDLVNMSLIFDGLRGPRLFLNWIWSENWTRSVTCLLTLTRIWIFFLILLFFPPLEVMQDLLFFSYFWRRKKYMYIFICVFTFEFYMSYFMGNVYSIPLLRIFKW